ncbi:MAG TPA: hypothetical protein VJ914_29500 [Pseudonocardiaceae bacterium]|nr:hypothetical protein [Pseudonocardiaceae bacterium]
MAVETCRPIIDAGPGLNFLSINKERLLISVLGKLSAPEAVQAEVFRKARNDARFRSAATVWQKLTPHWISILPNDQTPELAATIQRIGGQPVGRRLAQSKDLGEFMVVVHAVVAAEAGAIVTVLIDDSQGARTATAEITRLKRLRTCGRPVGSIRLVSTPAVLELAAGGPHIPDRGAMRTIYGRLRCLDDGLPPIERTNLLTSARWR